MADIQLLGFPIDNCAAHSNGVSVNGLSVRHWSWQHHWPPPALDSLPPSPWIPDDKWLMRWFSVEILICASLCPCSGMARGFTQDRVVPK